ncbi:MAG: Mov34/MPN/PAD-1 family protein [Paenibacillaceae bacterium]
MPRLIYNQIEIYCRDQLPCEACGALLGIQELATIVIEQFIPLSNMALNREAEFEIDEREWTQLLFDGLARDQYVMGLIHSHPTTPAIPSYADLQTLWYTLPTHWIISYIDMNSPVLKAFGFHADGTYKQVNWVIQD